jgi:hypothetical protein
MNGIHDLGGMQGFGPVVREKNEPVFHADWERHVFAMLNLTMAAGQYNVDEVRLLDRKGVVTRAELAQRIAELTRKGQT